MYYCIVKHSSSWSNFLTFDFVEILESLGNCQFNYFFLLLSENIKMEIKKT